jgi:hypothetical protein
MPYSKERTARYARGAQHYAWKGGRTTINGYAVRRVPEHPRADANGYVYEHVLVVEAALGKWLRRTAAMHHVNGDKQDNRPQNLVACENNAYHMLLHLRERARHECGHPNWRKCAYCGRYDAPSLLYISEKPSRPVYHRSCNAQRERDRRRRTKDAA